MNYGEAIKILTNPKNFNVELGLDRISKVLKLLDNPQDKLKCIHVAGTNGKGSVCAILNSILKEAGFKVGLYTSPHIFEYTERIKISDVEISKEDFAKYLDLIYTTAKKHNIFITEFEILTAIMFKYFADNNIDIAVIETGLGGRFDATNVIKSNLCSIITHIDYDHTERLGNTLEKIAFEKAGIIKENSTVIVSEGYEVFQDKSDEKNCLYMVVTPFNNTQNLTLKGLHQKTNLSLAHACITRIFPDISEEVIQRGLKNVKNPFRFEYFENKNLIIDVAHNPNGISALRENLDFYYPNIKRRFIFGCLKNKDYKKMINILFKEDDEIYFYHFNYPNSAETEDLRKACPFKSYDFNESFKTDKTKLTVVCGSFYMLKELLPKVDLLFN